MRILYFFCKIIKPVQQIVPSQPSLLTKIEYTYILEYSNIYFHSNFLIKLQFLTSVIKSIMFIL